VSFPMRSPWLVWRSSTSTNFITASASLSTLPSRRRKSLYVMVC